MGQRSGQGFLQVVACVKGQGVAELCSVVCCVLDARWGHLFAAEVLDAVCLTPLLVRVRNIPKGFSYTYECKSITWPHAWLTLARGVSCDAEHVKYAWLHLF